jgi:hypothetical protein
MSADIQTNITMKVLPYQWYSNEVTDETDPTGVYSPLKDLIGNSKPTPIRVAIQLGNGQPYYHANTTSELNETEKKFERILYNHLPEEAKSWLTKRCEENAQARNNRSCSIMSQ